MRNNQAVAIRKNIFSIVHKLRNMCHHDLPGELRKLTVNQIRVLDRVYVLTRTRPEGISLKTLADSLQITNAATSEMVETLVHKTVITRVNNPNDRRAISIRLSEDWDRRLSGYELLFDNITSEFAETLPAEKLTIFSEIMEDFELFVSGKADNDIKND